MYDLAIIGAGWAGYKACLRAKQLGFKVALIDKAQVGGTCLNLGCIPAKTLIQSARVFNLVKKSSGFGINSASPTVDFLKVQERKDKIIQQLRNNMQAMLKDIDYLSGEARILSLQEIKVSGKTIQSRYILIASGSIAYELPQFKFDAKKILSSSEILSLKEIPGSLLIIGGGFIGCEFAGLFSALGTKVTLVEKMPRLLPGVDKEVVKKIEAAFKKKGINLNTNSDTADLNPDDFDIVLVCVGRIPQTQGLGLEELGINLEKGRIITDDYLNTNIGNIYAAGDCTARIMLAHFAGYQGFSAAGNMANPDNRARVNSINIPSCIFTDPEIATVGLNEDEAVSTGLDIDIRKFDFLGLSMARILDETEGFIKIVLDRKTGVVIGASIIGPKATELISILTLAVSSRININELRQVIFSHPTLSESVAEALK